MALDRSGGKDGVRIPFADDLSPSRDTAFAKIRARVEGTALAAQVLGV